MKPLSPEAFQALITQYAACPGIVAGIREAHRLAGGTESPSFADFFADLFRRKA